MDMRSDKCNMSSFSAHLVEVYRESEKENINFSQIFRD